MTNEIPLNDLLVLAKHHVYIRDDETIDWREAFLRHVKPEGDGDLFAAIRREVQAAFQQAESIHFESDYDGQLKHLSVDFGDPLGTFVVSHYDFDAYRSPVQRTLAGAIARIRRDVAAKQAKLDAESPPLPIEPSEAALEEAGRELAGVSP